MAVRFASIIIGHPIEPDIRKYESYREWCLFYSGGSCGECIARCPAGAISKNGHDKRKCAAYLNEMNEKNLSNPIFYPNVEVGCGLCQSNVPCADRVPAR